MSMHLNAILRRAGIVIALIAAFFGMLWGAYFILRLTIWSFDRMADLWGMLP